MICRYQTAEGRIWLAEDKIFWNTCVKREGHVGKSHRFIKFVEAVDWVEQKEWNQSRILHQFKTGEIVRRRFGYQEVETGFITLLGACGQTDQVWEEEKNRGEFMEWKSLRESLSNALNVNDYRDFLGVSAELISDEQLLDFMHETRSKSKFVPDEARRESRIWLAEHRPLE